VERKVGETSGYFIFLGQHGGEQAIASYLLKRPRTFFRQLLTNQNLSFAARGTIGLLEKLGEMSFQAWAIFEIIQSPQVDEGIAAQAIGRNRSRNAALQSPVLQPKTNPITSVSARCASEWIKDRG
jgi:hypothetical protein